MNIPRPGPMTIIEAEARIQAILRQVELDQRIVILEIDIKEVQTQSGSGPIRPSRVVCLKPSAPSGAWAGEG